MDEALRNDLKEQLYEATRDGQTKFEEAIQQDYWPFRQQVDKNGNPVQPIRHVRIFKEVYNPAAIRTFRAFRSAKDHKQHLYAVNGEIPICAIYEGDADGKRVRLQKTYSLLEMAESKRLLGNDLLVEENQEFLAKKKKYLIPLYAVLKVGQKVLFYDNDLQQLKALPQKELARRLYIATNFGEGKIYFRHQLAACLLYTSPSPRD